MQSLIARIYALADRVQDALTGEPARFIFYGAAITVWAVVAITNALGINRFGPNISLTDALTQATLAGAFLTELIRRYVYSPNTVVDGTMDALNRGIQIGLNAGEDVPIPADLPETDDLDS